MNTVTTTAMRVVNILGEDVVVIAEVSAEEPLSLTIDEYGDVMVGMSIDQLDRKVAVQQRRVRTFREVRS